MKFTSHYLAYLPNEHFVLKRASDGRVLDVREREIFIQSYVELNCEQLLVPSLVNLRKELSSE